MTMDDRDALITGELAPNMTMDPEQVQQKAQDLSEKISRKVDEVSSQVKTRAEGALDATANKVNDVTRYFQGTERDQMIDDAREVVRKHPGKSLLFGLVFGLLLGRLFNGR